MGRNVPDLGSLRTEIIQELKKVASIGCYFLLYKQKYKHKRFIKDYG